MYVSFTFVVDINVSWTHKVPVRAFKLIYYVTSLFAEEPLAH